MPPVGIPNRLRIARTMARLTQPAVADAAGIGQGHLSDIENGNYSDLLLDTARKLAGVFGATVDDLFPAREAVEAQS